ncbi:ABC [Ectocarpus sp. CCAP 1310/34]|nr:ABC [Ectocarpus sp. CCAP 1310/34]
MSDMEAGGGGVAPDVPVPKGGGAIENRTGTTGESMSSKIGTGGNHTLSVMDLTYSVQVTDKDTKEKQTKTLLHPVTFSIKPTEMLAIMGASGAGKSTLLDVLAQRVPFSEASGRTDYLPTTPTRPCGALPAVEGSYLLNGQAIQPKEFKRMSGYVMQDDALYPLLTVRETLRFAAELRIPNMTKADKYELVEETIRQLKLTNCADTKIGNEIHRGVSGGEKRRVSIGVDTVQQPTIIFLDEPTSGLDSTTALTIAQTLSSVCKRNRTVAMTIHQPSTRVLDVFDKVMFLSRGRVVYFGRPADLPAYCTGLGKTPPAYSNIGEFFLEVVDEYETADNVKALADSHHEAVRMRAPSTAGVEADALEDTGYDYANPMLNEIIILLRRQWINVVRTPELAVVRVVMCSVVALVLGSLFWMTDADAKGFGGRAAYFAFG